VRGARLAGTSETQNWAANQPIGFSARGRETHWLYSKKYCGDDYDHDNIKILLIIARMLKFGSVVFRARISAICQ
jgi:hypothetical protein